MAQEFELRITSSQGTQSSHLESARAIIARLPRNPALDPTLIEIFQNTEPLIYLMHDSQRLHLSLWINSEEWYILTDPKAANKESTVDIGWNRFAEWTTFTDFDSAIKATARFIEFREIDTRLEWLHESA